MTPSQTWSDDDHVCDGVIDCPNDKSDEEKCTCYNQNINESSSAVCKITYPGKRKIFCSNLSSMTKIGNCHKYTNFFYNTSVTDTNIKDANTTDSMERFICDDGKAIA